MATIKFSEFDAGNISLAGTQLVGLSGGNSAVNARFTAADLVNGLATVTYVDSQDAGLQSQITQNTNDIAAIDTASIIANVTTLQGQVTVLQGNIVVLDSAVAALENNVSVNQDDIVVLQGNVIQIENELANIADTDNQTLSYDGATANLSISNGNNVVLQEVLDNAGNITVIQGQIADLQANGNIQLLSLDNSSNVLSISGGNTVDFTTVLGNVAGGDSNIAVDNVTFTVSSSADLEQVFLDIAQYRLSSGNDVDYPNGRKGAPIIYVDVDPGTHVTANTMTISNMIPHVRFRATGGVDARATTSIQIGQLNIVRSHVRFDGITLIPDYWQVLQYSTVYLAKNQALDLNLEGGLFAQNHVDMIFDPDCRLIGSTAGWNFYEQSYAGFSCDFNGVEVTCDASQGSMFEVSTTNSRPANCAITSTWDAYQDGFIEIRPQATTVTETIGNLGADRKGRINVIGNQANLELGYVSVSGQSEINIEKTPTSYININTTVSVINASDLHVQGNLNVDPANITVSTGSRYVNADETLISGNVTANAFIGDGSGLSNVGGVAQTLSWDTANANLSISGGNTVTLDGLGGGNSNIAVATASDGQDYLTTFDTSFFITADPTATDTGYIAMGEASPQTWNSGAFVLHGSGLGQSLLSGKTITNKIGHNGPHLGIAAWNDLYLGTRYAALYTDNSYDVTLSATSLGHVALAIDDVDKLVVDGATDKVIIETELDVNGTGTHTFKGTLEFTQLTNFGGTVGITALLDEDDMVSDSATALATQQSIKAYVDAKPLSGVAIGPGLVTEPTAGDQGIGMGDGADAALQSIAIGLDADASVAFATAIGKNSTATGNFGIAIGEGATAGLQSVALGFNADASQNYVTAIGWEAVATGPASSALGHECEATAAGAIAIGSDSTATQVATLAIGYKSDVQAPYSTSIGWQNDLSSAAAYTVSIGSYASNNTYTQSDAIKVSAGATHQTQLEVRPDYLDISSDNFGIACNASVGFTFTDAINGNVTLTSLIGGGGNPFDQDLNTTDTPEFQGVTATTGTVRLANLTTTERNALTAANGDMVYNITDSKLQGYQAGAWINLDGS